MSQLTVHALKGQAVVIHGPNVSGKITACDTIAGLHRVTDSTIAVNRKVSYNLSSEHHLGRLPLKRDWRDDIIVTNKSSSEQSKNYF